MLKLPILYTNTYIYQLWTFDKVDTLFYGPARMILTEKCIRSIKQGNNQFESP